MTTKANSVGNENVFMPAAGWDHTADTHSELKTEKGNRFMHAVNHRIRVSMLIICLTIVFAIIGLNRPTGWAATDPEWDPGLHLPNFNSTT